MRQFSRIPTCQSFSTAAGPALSLPPSPFTSREHKPLPTPVSISQIYKFIKMPQFEWREANLLKRLTFPICTRWGSGEVPWSLLLTMQWWFSWDVNLWSWSFSFMMMSRGTLIPNESPTITAVYIPHNFAMGIKSIWFRSLLSFKWFTDPMFQGVTRLHHTKCNYQRLPWTNPDFETVCSSTW